jgi:hypothetical protein
MRFQRNRRNPIEEILAILQTIECRLDRMEQIMSNTQADVDTLNQSITDLEAEESAVEAEFATLEAQIQALSQSADPAIKDQISRINVQVQKLKDAVAGANPTPPPPPPPPPAALPVYTHDGPVDSADAAAWPATNPPLVTADGNASPLFNFAQDVAGEPAKGDGLGGVWHLYTGATQPA